MSKDKAMKLALEALMRSRKAVSGDLDLVGCAYGSNDPDGHRYDDAKEALVTLDKAITALREALAEQSAQKEPVAWPCVIAEADFEQNTITLEMQCSDYKVGAGQHWLYTSPPAQRTWVGLTIGEIQDLIQFKEHSPFALAEDIEAKLKELNT